MSDSILNNRKQLISRIAPTPSGYLHRGNIFNFIYVWALVRRQNGVLHLRIDDGDEVRCKLEYVENIFKTLDMIGIDFDRGPFSVDQYLKSYRQKDRVENYRDTFNRMIDKGLKVFRCDCTRQQIRARSASNEIYDGFCLAKKLAVENTNVRVDVSLSDMLMKHFVIWQKNDTPAYQLTSLVDDLDMKVNLIVRGQDLFASTQAQIFLSQFLAPDFKAQTKIIHHQLLLDANGQKLSKEQKAQPFELAMLPRVIALVGQELGLERECVTLKDLIDV